ncbi:MAG: hypothetical protein QNJ72_17570 [Pleurocapsa sp. MO_226.B13]|nr:hypothetical protein [Pleurocapsa sp. MO_226.B13]
MVKRSLCTVNDYGSGERLNSECLWSSDRSVQLMIMVQASALILSVYGQAIALYSQ